MGAYYEDYMIKGKASQSEVNDWLENQQAEDNACNGHRHGYSADTQTINRVELHDVTFKSDAEASEYCGQMAQKWEIGRAHV